MTEIIEIDYADPRAISGLMSRLMSAIQADTAAVGTLDPDAVLNALLMVVAVMIDAHPDASERARMVATTRYYCDTELRADEKLVKRFRKALDKITVVMNTAGSA